FTARASRPEFWWFVLATFVATGVLTAIAPTIGIIASLALFVPYLAAGIRRLHDTNRSGWFWLIGLVPFVGVIILIVWLATDGDAGANQYGDRPA
ncbi:MAG: DUF805 domain-containing protein, partial [bacterium]|nr:DUF805 domain-containing protein [bacterium]